MATLDEVERSFRADPALADLLAALDQSAAVVAAAGLSADDLLADLPAIRERVARETYGDAFMDELHRDDEALRAAGTLAGSRASRSTGTCRTGVQAWPSRSTCPAGEHRATPCRWVLNFNEHAAYTRLCTLVLDDAVEYVVVDTRDGFIGYETGSAAFSR
jgi:hypothetical protein